VRDLRPQVVLAFRTQHGALGWARAPPTGSRSHPRTGSSAPMASSPQPLLPSARTGKGLSDRASRGDHSRSDTLLAHSPGDISTDGRFATHSASSRPHDCRVRPLLADIDQRLGRQMRSQQTNICGRFIPSQPDAGLTHRATNDWCEEMTPDVELTRDVGRCHHPAKRDLVPWPPGIECDVGPPARADQYAASLSSRDVLTAGEPQQAGSDNGLPAGNSQRCPSRLMTMISPLSVTHMPSAP
jgi:hypothetical protein